MANKVKITKALVRKEVECHNCGKRLELGKTVWRTRNRNYYCLRHLYASPKHLNISLK